MTVTRAMKRKNMEGVVEKTNGVNASKEKLPVKESTAVKENGRVKRPLEHEPRGRGRRRRRKTAALNGDEMETEDKSNHVAEVQLKEDVDESKEKEKEAIVHVEKKKAKRAVDEKVVDGISEETKDMPNTKEETENLISPLSEEKSTQQELLMSDEKVDEKIEEKEKSIVGKGENKQEDVEEKKDGVQENVQHDVPAKETLTVEKEDVPEDNEESQNLSAKETENVNNEEMKDVTAEN